MIGTHATDYMRSHGRALCAREDSGCLAPAPDPAKKYSGAERILRITSLLILPPPRGTRARHRSVKGKALLLTFSAPQTRTNQRRSGSPSTAAWAPLYLMMQNRKNAAAGDRVALRRSCYRYQT